MLLSGAGDPQHARSYGDKRNELHPAMYGSSTWSWSGGRLDARFSQWATRLRLRPVRAGLEWSSSVRWGVAVDSIVAGRDPGRERVFATEEQGTEETLIRRRRMQVGPEQQDRAGAAACLPTAGAVARGRFFFVRSYLVPMSMWMPSYERDSRPQKRKSTAHEVRRVLPNVSCF